MKRALRSTGAGRFEFLHSLTTFENPFRGRVDVTVHCIRSDKMFQERTVTIRCALWDCRMRPVDSVSDISPNHDRAIPILHQKPLAVYEARTGPNAEKHLLSRSDVFPCMNRNTSSEIGFPSPFESGHGTTSFAGRMQSSLPKIRLESRIVRAPLT